MQSHLYVLTLRGVHALKGLSRYHHRCLASTFASAPALPSPHSPRSASSLSCLPGRGLVSFAAQAAFNCSHAAPSQLCGEVLRRSAPLRLRCQAPASRRLHCSAILQHAAPAVALPTDIAGKLTCGCIHPCGLLSAGVGPHQHPHRRVASRGARVSVRHTERLDGYLPVQAPSRRRRQSCWTLAG